MTYIKQLDGLRAFAVISVMLFHLGIPFFSAGWLGVPLFFVLSGFLITGILINNKNKPHRFKNFYIRRSLRIFPLYYFYILVVFLFCTYLGVQDPNPWWWYLTYTQNYFYSINNFHYVSGQELGHTWSLAVEEQFYLLWPFVVLLCSRYVSVIAAIILCIVSISLRYYLTTHTSIVAFSPLFSSMDMLLVGGLLAYSSLNYRLFKSFSLLMLFIGSAWTFMIVKYDMFVFGGHYGITGPNQSFFISSTLLFAGIIGVISSGIIKAEFLNFKPLNYLGRISYGLYIWHPFVNIVVDVVLYRGYFTFITGWYVVASKLILTVVVASISYFYLELPFLRLKEKYTK